MKVMVILVKICQTEVTIEIYSKGLSRAIGKVLLMEIGYDLIRNP